MSVDTKTKSFNFRWNTYIHKDINRVSSLRSCLNETYTWFLEGNALLRHWYTILNETSNRYKTSPTYQGLSRLPEQFLQGNVPLRHLLNAKSLFMPWMWSAFNAILNDHLWLQINRNINICFYVQCYNFFL